jgi:hypothetical protein
MKYLKTYEKILLRNIIPGRVYRITEFVAANNAYRSTIPLGRLISCDEDKYNLVMKTYLKGTYESYTVENFMRRWLKNIATTEEIEQFEEFEEAERIQNNMNKYNL